ncbi:lipoprotein-releasing ABC transporter permease subunit [Steroidobacter sp. S1-65]|uniref:Lipoprotein-releasing ABC transporter permease subunit n=1 Tax=Steroidobacter gossypii TaxID=2805490 RepID=A0ABS1WW12_9GAMM|nr:lipoprotein-releasing ABC transporter permease subunit [Steroidobacter gossypii]MBM0105137.1 lipoprotein-releasing ABC transporter permease subunit [Steroidobacter gossypii]
MFHPLPLYIGLRYVRSRSQGFFVSFISWVSMLGICVGVAALITVISVMNGLEGEMRGRLLSLASHATLSGEPEQLEDWPELAERIRKEEGVVGVAPFIDLQGMLGRGEDMRAALIRGVDPELESQVSDVGAHMQVGRFSDLIPGEQHIILGSGLAYALDARVGDEITVLVPAMANGGEGAIAGIDLKPRIQNFIVSGVFEAGAQELDNVLGLVHLQDASGLAGTHGIPGGLRLKFDDIFAAPVRTPQINQALGGQLKVSDWSIENASYFRAVRIEKTMMSLILMLIVAVAAFNIVAALVMVVNEKRTDIAILRTVGMTPRDVIGVFMTQGVLIGWFGALLGLIVGLLLAFNVGTIVPFLEGLAGVKVFDPTVFVISDMPSEVQWPQVITITVTALVLTVLATIYPSLRGAATEPAEALRYE